MKHHDIVRGVLISAQQDRVVDVLVFSYTLVINLCLLMCVLETVQVEHSGDCADELIPLAAVLVCILEAIDMAPLRCEVTSQFAPWTSVLMGIDERIDSAMLGCPLASPSIPSTSVLVRILQALQHVVLGGHATRGFVPRATVLVSVGQAADHVVLGSFRTCSLRPTLIELKGMVEGVIK